MFGHVGECYLGAADVVVGHLDAHPGDTGLFGAEAAPHDGFKLLGLNSFSGVDLGVDVHEGGDRLASEDFERHCCRRLEVVERL